jgi:FMN phosphatase YigB (HAD superfamily)
MTDRKYILVDMDDTLTNSKWREELIDQSWDEFHQAADKDEPIWDILHVINALDNYLIVGLTARPERYRALTTEWCVRHGVKLHHLLMRPDDNYDPSPALKVYLAQCYFEGDFSDVKLMIDDHPGVIAAFRELGVTGLLVHSLNSRRQ